MTFDHVRLIGAFDRYNYGDLLLPLVTERALRRSGFNGTIEATSTRRTDLRARGVPEALPTSSFAQARRAGSAALHIVPGGEVLNANWIDTLASLLSPRAAWGLKASARMPLMSPLLERAIARALSGTAKPLLFPWVHDPRRWGEGVEVAYFAVGGTSARLSSRSRALLRERLDAASLSCARDRVTQSELGRDTLLAPDLVADAPSLLTEEELAPHLARLRNRFPRGWLTFQINRRLAHQHLPELASSLVQLAAQIDCAVVLLPLGRAARHEDQHALEVLEQLLEPEIGDLLLIHERSLFLAAAAIAGSRLFLGSSLHGNLTAMAYCVPTVPIGPVDKLERFLSTWCDETITPGPCTQILEAANRALDRTELARVSLAQRLSDSTRTAFNTLPERFW